MALFKALTFRRFALLWSGQALSRTGDAMYRVALAWWVMEKTGSAVEMGKLFTLSFAPMIVFLLFGGVAVDRWPKARLMLASDLLRGLVVGIVAVLAFKEFLQVWHLYIASIVFGIVSAFFQPSFTAILPEIIPAEALSSGNSLTTLSKQLADIAGPVLGAALIALGGPALVFAANGGSFFLSGVCLLPLLHPPAFVSELKSRAGVLRDMREGIETVLKLPWVCITISIAALSNITVGGPVSVALPFLIKNELHADAGAFGLVWSMLAMGSLLGTIWIGRRATIRHRGPLAYGAWIIIGVAILSFGLGGSIIVVCISAAILGAAVSIFSLIWIRTLQELVPRNVLGRVSSIDSLGSVALLPLGYGIIGWATDHFGTTRVFIISGACSICMVALGLSQRSIRNLD
jgi:DHA3 family tetracycline resistance protein-like MFS transporter